MQQKIYLVDRDLFQLTRDLKALRIGLFLLFFCNVAVAVRAKLGMLEKTLAGRLSFP